MSPFIFQLYALFGFRLNKAKQTRNIPITYITHIIYILNNHNTHPITVVKTSVDTGTYFIRLIMYPKPSATDREKELFASAIMSAISSLVKCAITTFPVITYT